MKNPFQISSISEKQKLFIGFVSIFLFMVILIYFFIHTSRQFNDSNEKIEHTNKILFTSQLVLSAAIDIETGIRGYLISGDNQYLKTFNKGQNNLAVNLEELKDLEKKVYDNAMQIAKLESLSVHINSWIRLSIKNIREIPANANLNSSDLKILENGRQMMESVRSMIKDFQDTEKRLLDNSKTDNQLNIDRSYKIVYAVIFFFVSIVITIWILLLVNLKEKELAYADTKKSEKFYKFTTQINDLILHENDIDKICSSVCPIAINTGDFLMAWIGEKHAESFAVVPLNWAGKEDGYLSSVKILANNKVPEGLGPSGRAIRDGKYYYCNDIENDPAMLPWRNEALKRGYLSSIALPILVEGKPRCLFTLYASRKDYFKEEEITLLNRVAENLGFAIQAIEIKEKQKETKTQLQKVMMAVEQSSSSIVITDIKGNIEYVNPAFSILTGYTFEEAIGKNPRILKTGYTRDEEYAELWQNITQYKSWQGEFQNKKKNGETYWEYAIISPIVNSEGDITNFVAVKENITERKNLQLILDEKNKLVNRILELTTDIISVLDIEGNRLFLSKSAEQKFGYSLEELIGQPAENIIYPEDRKKINLMIANLKRGISVKNFNTRYICKNGDIKNIDWSLTWDAESQRLYSIGRDMTKEKEEILRKEKEKAELENKIMRAVFEGEEKQNRSLSLELHDNINQILAASQIYLDMYIGNRNEELLSRIQKLLQQSVLEIRNLSHVIATPPVIDNKWVDSFRTLLKPFNDSTDISFEFLSDKDEYSISDELKINIYRIVQEQTKNIVKHSKAKHAIISISETDHQIQLQIKDDGIGFDSKQLNDGIGITNIRTRVDMFNGTFEIFSMPGQGCKMVLTFTV